MGQLKTLEDGLASGEIFGRSAIEHQGSCQLNHKALYACLCY